MNYLKAVNKGLKLNDFIRLKPGTKLDLYHAVNPDKPKTVVYTGVISTDNNIRQPRAICEGAYYNSFFLEDMGVIKDWCNWVELTPAEEKKEVVYIETYVNGQLIKVEKKDDQ